jgi:hypothetical protein
MIVFPVKANTVLPVNANAPLPFPVFVKRFKLVSGGDFQFINAFCGIEHTKFSSGDMLYVSGKFPGIFTFPYQPRRFVSERNYHEAIISQNDIIVNQALTCQPFPQRNSLKIDLHQLFLPKTNKN